MSNKSMEKILEEISNLHKEFETHFDKTAETWWDNLSYEDKLKAFYCVSKRIHKGEIKDKGSYRHVLYSVFGFNPDAYVIGMNCGYLDIHNSIVPPEDYIREST